MAFLRGLAVAVPRAFLARSLTSSPSLQGNVAVVLSGCGVYDGSEIHEASAILVHLSRHNARVSMFAPDIPQMHVINHLVGEPNHTEQRNVLEESARIARGKISPLAHLTSSDFDAVILPGGFGAAKNLSTYAVEGEGMEVNVEAERVLREFHSEGKPIGLCCIAPILAAKVFPGVELTVGSDSDPAAAAIAAMGGKHVEKLVTESCVDDDLRIVSTPAFMYGEAPLHEIFDGIGGMVATVMDMIR